MTCARVWALAGIVALASAGCGPSAAERSALRQQAATTMGMWMRGDFPGLERATAPKMRPPLGTAEHYEFERSQLEQQYGRAVKYNIFDVSPATLLGNPPFTHVAAWSVSVDVTGERATYRLALSYITMADGKTYLVVIGQPGTGSGRG